MIYTGPVYAVEKLIDCLCPWCIADGSAAARFDATFTDYEPVPEGVQRVMLDVVTKRTPGFSGWQQEHWLYHCGDGGVPRARRVRAGGLPTRLQRRARSTWSMDGHPS